jgi:sporulation protein YlmC with PRC-barrel domain
MLDRNHLNLIVALCIAVLAMVARPGWASASNTEAAEMATGLIGAPVFANDGTEVGVVADVAFDDELQPQRLRMTTASHLGLGTRTIELPKGAFIALQGAVVLDVPTEAVSAFAELAQPMEEK